MLVRSVIEIWNLVFIQFNRGPGSGGVPCPLTPLPARGPIHLQTHGGAMHWRNIFVREIGAEEANRLVGDFDYEGLGYPMTPPPVNR